METSAEKTGRKIRLNPERIIHVRKPIFKSAAEILREFDLSQITLGDYVKDDLLSLGFSIEKHEEGIDVVIISVIQLDRIKFKKGAKYSEVKETGLQRGLSLIPKLFSYQFCLDYYQECRQQIGLMMKPERSLDGTSNVLRLYHHSLAKEGRNDYFILNGSSNHKRECLPTDLFAFQVPKAGAPAPEQTSSEEKQNPT